MNAVRPTLRNEQTVRTVRGRLNAERRAERFVYKPSNKIRRSSITNYQDRAGGFREELGRELNYRQGKTRALVTGQIGVGKSSELYRFHQGRLFDAASLSFPIFCDLEKHGSPEHCMATAVFLTVLRACWTTIRGFRGGDRAELERIRNDLLDMAIQTLNAERSQEGDRVKVRSDGMDAEVLIKDDPSGALEELLDKAARHLTTSIDPERFGLVPDQLVTLINRTLDWHQRGMGRSRPPTLIIDHVDKIRNQGAALDVLVKARPHWDRLNASVVMTAPFEYTMGEFRGDIESHWDLILKLYPLPIPASDAPDSQVPTIYRKIASESGLFPHLVDGALPRLAHASGGILRTYVQMLIECVRQAVRTGHDLVEHDDVSATIMEFQRSYQDYRVDHLRLLDEIVREQTGLGEAAYLLRSPIGLLVMEPQGDQSPLRPHPLAVPALERYRLRARRDLART